VSKLLRYSRQPYLPFLCPAFLGILTHWLSLIWLLFLQNAGKNITLAKSDRDTRYSKNEITTHDGIARRCHAVNTLAELRSAVGESYDSVDVIAIDEAQFFPDLLEFCTEASDRDNKQVLVAGLDGDFKRQRFGQVRAHTLCPVHVLLALLLLCATQAQHVCRGLPIMRSVHFHRSHCI